MRETKQQAYENFKQVYADRPDLLAAARPEAMPAIVLADPAGGQDRLAVINALRTEFPSAQVKDLCPAPA